MRSFAAIVIALVLSGCASVEPEPVESPDPVYGTDPDGNRTIGYLHIAFDVVPAGPNVPTDVDMRMVIETTNAVGQHLPGDVIWTLAVDGPTSLTRSGQGLSYEETIRFDERGAYRATLTASAPRFFDNTVTADFALDPIPLEASLAVPENETRGDWFDIHATASHGFSDLGYTCAWQEDPAIQYEDAGACTTQARWLEDGNQTASLTVDDGNTTVSVDQTVPVLPLARAAMPGSVPSDAQISEADDNPNTTPDHVNVRSGWMSSDLDHVYLGLKVAAIQNEAVTRDTVYSFTFTPSWGAPIEGVNATKFRVSSTFASTEGEEPAPPRQFHLEAEVAGSWQVLSTVDGATRSGTMFWWPVPRADIQAPLEASISDLVIQADGPLGDDSASTQGPFALY